MPNDYGHNMQVGRLGRDPELRYSGSGTAFTRFSIAVNNGRYDKDTDEWIENTDWLNFITFGKYAEVVAQKLAKGTRVIVEYNVKPNVREDKESGTKYYGYDLIAYRHTILEYPKDDKGSSPTVNRPADTDDNNPFDEDVPF